VQEDEGRVALAADLADDLQPVVGPEGLLDRLASGFAADYCRQPQTAIRIKLPSPCLLAAGETDIAIWAEKKKGRSSIRLARIELRPFFFSNNSFISSSRNTRRGLSGFDLMMSGLISWSGVMFASIRTALSFH
jgi:hypothetical protein